MKMTRTLLLSLLAGPLTFGCANDEGLPQLSLSDAAYRGCEGSRGGLERPYAVGARIDLQAKRGDALATLIEVTAEDPTVLTVEAVDNPATLRAVSPGATDVSVRASDGARGVERIEVAAIARVTIAR